MCRAEKGGLCDVTDVTGRVHWQIAKHSRAGVLCCRYFQYRTADTISYDYTLAAIIFAVY